MSELVIRDDALLIRPGDLVVVQLRDGMFSQKAAERIRETVKPLEAKHGVSFLVVDASIDLSVMRPVDGSAA